VADLSGASTPEARLEVRGVAGILGPTIELIWSSIVLTFKGSNRVNAGWSGMCDHCAELDKKIAHMQVLALGLWDPQTIEAANKLIKDMRSQKVALHLEDQK
jgi:hypothetical protein